MVSIHAQLNVFQGINDSKNTSMYSHQRVAHSLVGDGAERQSVLSEQAQVANGSVLEKSTYVEIGFQKGADQYKVSTSSVEQYRAIGESSSPSDIAANNILKFVAAQLQRDLDGGATEEQLRSRLQSGAEGFIQGFNEGLEQVESLGWATPEVSASLQNTFEKVRAGFATLAEKYSVDLPENMAAEKPANSESDSLSQGQPAEAALLSQIPTETSVNSGTIQMPPHSAPAIAASMSSLSSRLDSSKQQEASAVENAVAEQATFHSLQGSNSSSVSQAGYKAYEFAVTTAEGDVVTVSAYAEFGQFAENGVGGAYMQDRFNFIVEGELDEAEFQAINDLLAQVNDVADVFFSGDVYAAYESALEIGFDNTELLQFSFSLQQAQVTRVEEVYREVQDMELAGPSREQGRMQLLGEFVNKLNILQQGLASMGLNLQIAEDLFGLLDRVGSEDQAEPRSLKDLTRRLNPHLTALS